MKNSLAPDAVWIKPAAASENRGFTIGDLATGETITSVACASTPSGLTVGATGTVSGANVSTLISGGTAGKEYRVRYTIVTSAQPVVIRDLIVKVIA